MDMLYSRYSNPLDLMNTYINQGRFGTFVKGFLEAEHKRKIDEAEKDNDLKLWIAYVHSESEKSYGEWKKSVVKPKPSPGAKSGGDENLDDEGIENIIKNLFPQKQDKKNGGGS